MADVVRPPTPATLARTYEAAQAYIAALDAAKAAARDELRDLRKAVGRRA